MSQAQIERRLRTISKQLRSARDDLAVDGYVLRRRAGDGQRRGLGDFKIVGPCRQPQRDPRPAGQEPALRGAFQHLDQHVPVIDICVRGDLGSALMPADRDRDEP